MPWLEKLTLNQQLLSNSWSVSEQSSQSVNKMRPSSCKYNKIGSKYIEAASAILWQVLWKKILHLTHEDLIIDVVIRKIYSELITPFFLEEENKLVNYYNKEIFFLMNSCFHNIWSVVAISAFEQKKKK